MYIVRQCTKCKDYKLLDKFYNQITGRYGKCSYCKSCHKKYRVERYKDPIIKNKEKIRNNIWLAKNKQKIELYRKKRAQAKAEEVEVARKKKKLEKEKITEKKCNKCNEIKKISNFYKDRNGYRFNCKNCQRIDNKKNIKKYVKKRKKIDPLFKLQQNIRCSIRNSIRKQGYTKRSSTHKILGCDFETLKKHIERQFTKGMTWDNQGEWHLDHIYPVSLAKNEEELIKLNHYTNFQPLWAEDNLRKSNNIEEHQIKLRI